MQVSGYVSIDVNPWEGASDGKAVTCETVQCTATMRWQGEPGWYTLRVRYFDQNDGEGNHRVFVDDQLVDEWRATYWVPSARVDSSTSARRVISGVALRDSVIRIEGVPNEGDLAALDYIEIIPE